MKLWRKKKKKKSIRHRFSEGDVLQCQNTGRIFVVERVAHPDPMIQSTWYLRSQAGHLGRPKSPWFLDLQIEDGYLKKLPRKAAPKLIPLPDILPFVEVSRFDLDIQETA